MHRKVAAIFGASTPAYTAKGINGDINSCGNRGVFRLSGPDIEASKPKWLGTPERDIHRGEAVGFVPDRTSKEVVAFFGK